MQTALKIKCLLLNIFGGNFGLMRELGDGSDLQYVNPYMQA